MNPQTTETSQLPPYLYVLSCSAMRSMNRYKIGSEMTTMMGLENDYREALIDPEIFVFISYELLDDAANRLLKSLDQYVVKDGYGCRTSWVEASLDVIKQHIGKLLMGIEDTTEVPAPKIIPENVTIATTNGGTMVTSNTDTVITSAVVDTTTKTLMGDDQVSGQTNTPVQNSTHIPDTVPVQNPKQTPARKVAPNKDDESSESDSDEDSDEDDDLPTAIHKIDMETLMNIVKLLTDEFITDNSPHGFRTDQYYEKYCDYMNKNQYRPMTRTTFDVKVKSQGYETSSSVFAVIWIRSR